MNTITKNISKLAILAGAFAAIALFTLIATSGVSFAGVYVERGAANKDEFRSYQFFASSTAITITATTTTATSTNIVPYFSASGRYDDGTLDMRGAKKVNILFTRGDTSGQGNSGSSQFRVQVMGDGINWVDYNDLRQSAATSTTAINRVGIVTIAGTTTSIYSMETLGFQKLRCIVIETTDGEHTCTASAQY